MDSIDNVGGDLNPLVVAAFGAGEVQGPVASGLSDVLEAHRGRLRAAEHAVEERLDKRPVAQSRLAGALGRVYEPLGLLAGEEDNAALGRAHLWKAPDELAAGRVVTHELEPLGFAYGEEPAEKRPHGRDLPVNRRRFEISGFEIL